MVLQVRVPLWLAEQGAPVTSERWLDAIARRASYYRPSLYYGVVHFENETVMQVPYGAFGVMADADVKLRDAEGLCILALLDVLSGSPYEED